MRTMLILGMLAAHEISSVVIYSAHLVEASSVKNEVLPVEFSSPEIRVAHNMRAQRVEVS